MNNAILVIASVVIILGMTVGALIVGLIYLQRRRRTVVDSLIRINNVVGCFATVEVPFNQNSPGKVRVNLKGSVVDFVALTNECHHFNQGDSVVIVGIKGNKVWVVNV